MKKILSAVLVFVMGVSVTCAPVVALAVSPTTYAISINKPVAISGQTVTLTGNASSTNYNGQASAQFVSVWWTTAALSGVADVKVAVPSEAFSGKDFNWNWSFNHTYAPGTYTITAKVCHVGCTGVDSSGDSVATTTVVIPANNNPVLSLSTTTSPAIDELSTLSFTASATDADGDTISYSLSGSVPSGASINPTTGLFSWTPTETQGPGVYTFNVVASDGKGGTDSKAVTVTVLEVNTAPVAQPLSISTHQNTPVSASVVATDSDRPSNTLTFSVLTQPVVVGASVTMNTDGSFTYTPASNYNGVDSFTYQVSDGVLTSTATVSINVNNDAPILGVISDATVNELDTLSFKLFATDDPLDVLTYSLVGVIPVGVNLDSTTGAFTWTPSESQNGVYNFTASVSDGALSDSKTFKVTVNEVNSAPVTTDQTVTTNEDTSDSATLVATDSDIPANSLVFATTTNPAHGVISAFDTSTGVFTYVPNVDYFGTDSFGFNVFDGVVNSNSSQVNITVSPVNDVPTVTLTGSNSISMITTSTPFVDPGATGFDVEDGVLVPVVSGSVDTTTPGTYTLVYTVTDSNSASASTTRVVTVSTEAEVNPPVVTPPASIGNGPVNFGFVNGRGVVLGASTGPVGEVLGNSAESYLNSYIRFGSTKNNSDQVKRLQEFLNTHMNAQLPVTGFYGPMTLSAVKAFQLKYSDDILKPWGLSTPTGLVYLSTIRKINSIQNPNTVTELPALIPWSQNTNI